MISNTLDHVGIYASTVASMTLAASVMLNGWDDDKYNAASAAATATAAALQPIITIGIPTGPYLDKTEVRNNGFGTFGPLLYFKTRSFYQDRLGTNIAKAQKRVPFASRTRRFFSSKPSSPASLRAAAATAAATAAAVTAAAAAGCPWWW
eukprot:COSAG06_NODE_1278_length_10031_cov_105.662002_8_plen_150_part_00